MRIFFLALHQRLLGFCQKATLKRQMPGKYGPKLGAFKIHVMFDFVPRFRLFGCLRAPTWNTSARPLTIVTAGGRIVRQARRSFLLKS